MYNKPRSSIQWVLHQPFGKKKLTIVRIVINERQERIQDSQMIIDVFNKYFATISEKLEKKSHDIVQEITI